MMSGVILEILNPNIEIRAKHPEGDQFETIFKCEYPELETLFVLVIGVLVIRICFGWIPGGCFTHALNFELP